MSQAQELAQLRADLKKWKGELKARRGAYAKEKIRFAKLRRAMEQARAAIKHRRQKIKRLTTQASGGAQAQLSWLRKHLYHTEHPAGSNSDSGSDSITAWERHFGFGAVPWCGIFAGMGLVARGLIVPSWIASVGAIEDHARQGAGPFRGWSSSYASARPGDLVVLFGYGVHVETVVSVGGGGLNTYGGNTSSGAGSQSNGGGSFPRFRSAGNVRGIAHVR